GRADEAEHQLDERALAGAIMPGERNDLARLQGKVDCADRELPAIILGDSGELDDALAHGRGSSRAAAGTAGRAISRALSTARPGWIAGNCDCAQRTICVAGLLRRSFAAGARHTTWSMMSFGR